MTPPDDSDLVGTYGLIKNIDKIIGNDSSWR